MWNGRAVSTHRRAVEHGLVPQRNVVGPGLLRQTRAGLERFRASLVDFEDLRPPSEVELLREGERHR